jgi:hypothetical protein
MLDFEDWFKENRKELELAYKDFVRDAKADFVDGGWIVDFDLNPDDYYLEAYEEYLAEQSGGE